MSLPKSISNMTALAPSTSTRLSSLTALLTSWTVSHTNGANLFLYSYTMSLLLLTIHEFLFFIKLYQEYIAMVSSHTHTQCINNVPHISLVLRQHQLEVMETLIMKITCTCTGSKCNYTLYDNLIVSSLT